MISICRSIFSGRRKTPKFSSIDVPSSSRIAHGRSPSVFASSDFTHASASARAASPPPFTAGAPSAYSAAAWPERRPNVIVSISEFPPRRLAPCTETHADSPAA